MGRLPAPVMMAFCAVLAHSRHVGGFLLDCTCDCLSCESSELILFVLLRHVLYACVLLWHPGQV